MSETISKAQAALAKEEGKLKKLLKALKKIFAKEFLWVLLVLLISVPLALIIEYLLDKYPPPDGSLGDRIIQLIKGPTLFMWAYAGCIAGIYFTRMVVGAIKTLIEKKE